MPFAASVLDTRKADYFVDAKSAPYMIEAFDTKPLAEEAYCRPTSKGYDM